MILHFDSSVLLNVLRLFIDTTWDGSWADCSSTLIVFEFDNYNASHLSQARTFVSDSVSCYMPWEIVERKTNSEKNFFYLKMSLAIVLTAMTTWMCAKNYFEKDMSLPIEPVNRWKIAFFILLTMVVLILMIYMIWCCRKRWRMSRCVVKTIFNYVDDGYVPYYKDPQPVPNRRLTPPSSPKDLRHGRAQRGESRDNGSHRRSSTHSSSSGAPHAKSAVERGRAAIQHRWMMNTDRVGHNYDTIWAWLVLKYWERK